MASYKYTIKDYHAIKKAEIILDGITVLSGINGCGKSTLSRWLYYIINGSVNYEKNLFNEYLRSLEYELRKIMIGLVDSNRIIRLSRIKNLSENSNFDIEKVRALSDKLNRIKYTSEIDVLTAKETFEHVIQYIGNYLDEILEDLPNPRRRRIISYLGIEPKNDIDNYSENFQIKYTEFVKKISSNLIKDIHNRPVKSFFKHINDTFSIEEDNPQFIRLEEEGVEIIDGNHFGNIFYLQNAIYIDTPMSVTEQGEDNQFWERLHDIMLEDKKEVSIEAKKILFRIKNLIGGEAVLQKDDIFEETLRYVSSDKKIDINLVNAATGFKTFAYLQRLLENGYINEKTLLMIDEPEAHLHPQWIVDFARLLVLLNKKLGLKIMLASHNPDMIAAIQAIADKEGIAGHTNFYVAKQYEEATHQYVYKHLGFNINEIFESFNIALDRIRNYGNVDV